MEKELEALLATLYAFGTAHDEKHQHHSEQLLNITPDTGLFLSMLIQATRATLVLELGTSNGYSTLWIADALRQVGKGSVTTVEVSQEKFAMALKNFDKSGLSSWIHPQRADIRSFLKGVGSESVDLLFLDAERPQYLSYWEELDRALKTGGLLIVDNALSPKPAELIDFLGVIQDAGRYLTQTLQIGKGEFVALKQRGGK